MNNIEKYFLVIHTVFIPRENILYLEEWIVYHINIGVEHFYLYNNYGSTGYDGSSNIINKYGMNFNNPTSHLSDEDINKILEYIQLKYKNKVTIIKWQPKDNNNNISYGQSLSIQHLIDNFINNITWACLIDIDEFIFSNNNINLISYLKDTSYSNIKIFQKKFQDRFIANKKYVLQITECIDNIDTVKLNWAPKNIVKLENLKSLNNIHDLKLKNNYKELHITDQNILRFNHYNVNNNLLNWIKSFYNTNQDFKLNGIDTNLLDRYNYIINDLQKNSISMKVPYLQTTTIRINSGGNINILSNNDDNDSNNKLWSYDNYFVGGKVSNTTNVITNTSNSILYQSERFDNFIYTFTNLNNIKNYKIKLYFAEYYFNNIDERIFNVLINNNEILTNFDILKEVVKNTALIKEFTIMPSNGNIVINFVNVINEAKISAIEIDEQI